MPVRRAFLWGSNGNRQYSKLRFAKEDARSLASALRLPRYAFETEVQEDTSDPYDILRALKASSARCKTEDAFIVHFSGHGQVVGKSLYLVADRSDPDDLSTLFSSNWLIEAIAECRARNRLLILDCCHAGSATGVKSQGILVEELLPGLTATQQILYASGRLESARELEELGGSFVTRTMCKLLDSEHQERVTLSRVVALLQAEAHRFNQRQPSMRARVPIPFLSGVSQGEFCFDIDAHALEARDAALAPATSYHAYAARQRWSPLRRSILAGGALVGMSAFIGRLWGWGSAERVSSSWTSERILLEKAIDNLGYQLRQEQEEGGGFKGAYLTSYSSAYDTGQELSAMMIAVQVNPGVFEPERQARAIQALGKLSSAWNSEQSNVLLSEADVNFGTGKGPEAAYTAGICWAIIAAVQYVKLQNNSLAREVVEHLHGILLTRQRADGSFEYICDRENHDYASAYATVMSVWALCEIERAEMAREPSLAARRGGAGWLAAEYRSQIISVSGLAEQAFWVIEQSRDVDRRGRTENEDLVADILTRQLLVDCKASKNCGQALEGKIPNGRGSKKEYVMLWLPWATLASLRIMRYPSRLSAHEPSDYSELARTLIKYLGESGIASVSLGSRFQGAEYLLAMGEALMQLPA